MSAMNTAPDERELLKEFDRPDLDLQEIETADATPPDGWDENREAHIEAARSAYYGDLGVR